MRLLIFMFVLLLSVSACNNANKGDNLMISKDSFINKSFQLVSIDSKPVLEKYLKTSSSIIIDNELQATGTTGCNNYHGIIVLEANKLKIESMASTRKLCMDPFNNELENIFTKSVMQWNEVVLNQSKLTLKNKDHELIFQLKEAVN